MKKLLVPKGKIDVVLDTDTYNEIDDQFAVAYALRSDDKLCIKAIYAAPFFNSNSTSPADGMEKSYEEIIKLLTITKRENLINCVYKGADRYLPDENTPVISQAARDLVSRAMSYTPERPLYVVAIGAITNIASALLIAPEITDKIVVVWLGGHSHEWHDTREFNMTQDIAAARVIFGCDVSLVQIPCCGVASGFYTTKYELEHWLCGKNELCDYLASATIKAAESYASGKPWSRVIWDVVAVAWLLNDDDRFLLHRICDAPIPEYDNKYSFYKKGKPMTYVYGINRDSLMEDMMGKLLK